jgi:hypothetical protein
MAEAVRPADLPVEIVCADRLLKCLRLSVHLHLQVPTDVSVKGACRRGAGVVDFFDVGDARYVRHLRVALKLCLHWP